MPSHVSPASSILILALKSLSFHVDDDIIDKLNYYYTSSVITVFAVLVSAKQYVGNPIQCWVPATFTGPMEQYSENYCWTANTYYLPLHRYVPKEISDRNRRQIGYYQWVPFLLALEALLFYVPCIIWRLLSWQSGIHIQSLVQMACDCRHMDTDQRNKALVTIAAHIEDALHVRQLMSSHDKAGGVSPTRCMSALLCAKSSGSALTSLYLSIKLLYTLNVFGQIFLLNSFLGANSSMYGFYVLKDLLQGRAWQESGNFPRVTLCDFEVKVLGNVHRHTVQCVLMVNMFNEKIFLFLWFWYFLLALATFASLCYWVVISFAGARRTGFIGRYLVGAETGSYKMPVDQTSLRRFVLSFLRHDGVFLLRMTATHAGEFVCSELIKSLWTLYSTSKNDKVQEV